MNNSTQKQQFSNVHDQSPDQKLQQFAKPVNAENIQLQVPQQINQQETKPAVVENNREEDLMYRNQRSLPRFKKLEITFEVAALITFVLTWIYFRDEVNQIIKKPIYYYQYDSLPATVPVEFDIQGKPVRWAEKDWLYAFPGIGTVAYILLTVLQLVPHRFK